ncbi:MAG: response regulator transcription factor [Kiritimatiellia bacterium]
MADLLIAEDDADVRKWLTVALRSEGHGVRAVQDGDAALAALAERRPDALILDIAMPKRDGFSVCETVRRSDSALPILMLTAKSSPRDKVKGLGLGADDYMTKPFLMEELFARVGALLRRGRLVSAAAAGTAPFRVGGTVVDPARLVLVAADGAKTPLAAREFALLKLLAAHPGEVLARDRLLDEIWGVSFYGNTRTLDQHVALVRRKLGADAACVETVRNVGYRLANVRPSGRPA